ncbi:MAG: response regulator, partial [Clostridia bacterium]|nr:response regulator [Clostridia bacterium]
MKVICVDDERLIMDDTVRMCLEIPEISEAKGFVSGEEALDYLKSNDVDVALLDIDMPAMSGLSLAEKIKKISPYTSIIFVTGYSQYAVDAFKLRASGYLLKPVTKEDIERDIEYIRSMSSSKKSDHIEIKTFGFFEVFKDGKSVKFKISKCKELLAYLVDRQGSSVTRAELSSILWEDRLYDRKQQKQLDVYIRSLKDTLAEYGISEIFEMKGGTLRVVPESFTCDAYLFFSGDTAAVNAYRGEYMSSYSWASITEGLMFQKQSN